MLYSIPVVRLLQASIDNVRSGAMPDNGLYLASNNECQSTEHTALLPEVPKSPVNGFKYASMAHCDLVNDQ